MRIVLQEVLVHPDAGVQYITLEVGVPLFGRPVYQVAVRSGAGVRDARRYTSGNGQRWFAEAPSDLYSEGRIGTYGQAREVFHTKEPAKVARKDFDRTVTALRDRGYEPQEPT